MGTITVACANTTLRFCEETLGFSVDAHGQTWTWSDTFQPYLQLQDERKIFFSEAGKIRHFLWSTGVGRGIRSSYTGFSVDGTPVPFSFETVVWIEEITGDVFFEWIPICDEGLEILAVYWPGYLEFEESSPRWYSVLNILQGLLLPNNWENEVRKLTFDGQLCSSTAYMPWFGQVRPGSGYLAICRQPWDAAYQVDHPAGGPYTHISFRWLPSLGKMDYRRSIRYTFLENCDYNDLCKVYRCYARETGLLTTLREKAAKSPLVRKLIGSAIVHKGIKTHTSPDSRYYDPDHPEKNDSLIPFSVRAREIRHYREKGVEKLYLHLDGWGQPGYDNQHPDYLPACAEAGGWEGLKELSDTVQECGYMLGLHDQYRDYYFDAPTFDPDFACHAPDGSVFEMALWAGGRQTFLCASQAPYYVKRNFEQVLQHGIHLEASYLDVFTCNEPDECAHPWHRMSRRECLEYRNACFEYLLSRNILPSSEEVTDWAMKSLVFAHYAPYDFMLQAPDAPRKGIPVPLFNLVYHDCIIVPWLMDHPAGKEDQMLYALLNGGAAYLEMNGGIPDFEDPEAEAVLDEKIARWRITAALQERVAELEMVHHEFLEGDWMRQKSVFADGTAVTVNFHDNSYEISGPEI